MPSYPGTKSVGILARDSNSILLLNSNFLHPPNSLCKSYNCYLSYATYAELGSLFTIGLFLIFLALLAYLRLFKVSSKFISAGETQAIIEVLELPPKES